MNKRDITRRSFLRASSSAGLLAATGALGIAKPLPAGDAEQGTIAVVIPAYDSKMWSIPFHRVPGAGPLVVFRKSNCALKRTRTQAT
jgi:hypothetical protein